MARYSIFTTVVAWLATGMGWRAGCPKVRCIHRSAIKVRAVSLWYSSATLKPLVILQEFLFVQDACPGKLAVVERAPDQVIEIVL